MLSNAEVVQLAASTTFDRPLVMNVIGRCW